MLCGRAFSVERGDLASRHIGSNYDHVPKPQGSYKVLREVWEIQRPPEGLDSRPMVPKST